MIKWNCNFNIADSTIQLAEAFVKVVDYENINDHSIVNIIITDVTGEILVKEYSKEYSRTFLNNNEIYEELLLDYENAEIVN
jgi:hypothetical protein